MIPEQNLGANTSFGTLGTRRVEFFHGLPGTTPNQEINEKNLKLKVPTLNQSVARSIYDQRTLNGILATSIGYGA